VLERHPALIYCAISGFGFTGPAATESGYDLAAQARSGLMSVTGAAGGTPQRVSTALSDVATGIVAAFAATAALRRLERTGRGEFVDVSLLDTDLTLMAPRIASFLAGEPEPRPSGGTDSVLAVYQAFETRDRPIVVAVGNDAVWTRFAPGGAIQPLDNCVPVVGPPWRFGLAAERRPGRALGNAGADTHKILDELRARA
jgi:crotonobetainyl-CoA:carnitine CoA-transferase CaiB-like acyl-CoA transferase